MNNNTNSWIENTGTVPDGVGPDTVIEVVLNDGYGMLIPFHRCAWDFLGDDIDIIRWRLV